MTIELALVTALLAGFFGSSHCVGMCGAIVVLFEGPDSDRTSASVWPRRLTYNIGRGSFYALLGAVAGLTGALLTKTTGVEQGLWFMRLLAAALVIAIGLNLLFDWRLTRFLESAGAGRWQKMSRLARHVLPASTLPRAFGAGFIWGALPCGLVYSALAISATSGDALSGTAVMLAFWLGTLPTLLLVGTSAQFLTRMRRNKILRRVAGILVILVGLAALMPFSVSSNGHQHHAASASPTFAETQKSC